MEYYQLFKKDPEKDIVPFNSGDFFCEIGNDQQAFSWPHAHPYSVNCLEAKTSTNDQDIGIYAPLITSVRRVLSVEDFKITYDKVRNNSDLIVMPGCGCGLGAISLSDVSESDSSIDQILQRNHVAFSVSTNFLIFSCELCDALVTDGFLFGRKPVYISQKGEVKPDFFLIDPPMLLADTLDVDYLTSLLSITELLKTTKGRAKVCDETLALSRDGGIDIIGLPNTHVKFISDSMLRRMCSYTNGEIAVQFDLISFDQFREDYIDFFISKPRKRKPVKFNEAVG